MSKFGLHNNERELLRAAAMLGWQAVGRNGSNHIVLRHHDGRTSRIPRKANGVLFRATISRLRKGMSCESATSAR